MLYFAYGSNLDKSQMRYRCPNATPIKSIALDKHKLVFRIYADIQFDDNSIIFGGLWNITEDCEKALDRYEGVKRNLYRKKYFLYHGEKVLYYKMNDDYISQPYLDYAIVIRKGYNDFHLPLDPLLKSIKESVDHDNRFHKVKEKKNVYNFCN